MNKQKKQFIVILIILILCIIAYFLVQRYNKKTAEADEASEAADVIALTDFTADDVTEFSYQVDGSELSFKKDTDSWLYEGDSSVDIDEDSIATLLNSAGKITAVEKIDDVEDTSEFGFDAPSNTVTITTSDQTITLYIGNCNDMLSEYYVMLQGDSNVYLVDSTTGTLFSKTVAELTAVAESTETEDVTE